MKKELVSIIIPTRNEEDNLPRLLESIKRLDYPKNLLEVIVVDGYSTDQTAQIAKKHKAKILYNPSRIRGAGCQIGVKNAKGEIIAFTDADCIVPKNWITGLLKYLEGEHVVSVGGPNITPVDDTSFAKAAGETLFFLTKAGARYGYSGRKVAEIFHNPGCNVIYKKEAINAVGGFNPSLVTCEDEEFDFRLRQQGYKLLFTPAVVVDHYRRPTYKKILIQAYRFAIGRAQAIRFHPKMARWFHFVPSLLLLFLLLNLLSSSISSFSGSYIFLVFLLFTLVSFYLSITKRHAPFYIYFLILSLWFLGWGIGFVVGIIYYQVVPKRSTFLLKCI